MAAPILIQKGSTSKSVEILVRDSTTGQGKTGLDASTFPALSYSQDRTAPVAFGTLSDLAAVSTSFTAKGIKEKDSTKCPGLYRVDLPNAMVATVTGVDTVTLAWTGSGVLDGYVTVNLVGFDPTTPDKTGFELTSTANNAIRDTILSDATPFAGANVAAVKTKTDNLPSAAAGATGGLPTVDASNAVKVQSGTGANQLDLASGKVKLAANGLDALSPGFYPAGNAPIP